MNRSVAATLCALFSGCLCLMPGCAVADLFGTPRGDLAVTSSAGRGVLRPTFTTVVYRAADRSTVDIYLTDLPMDRVADGQDALADRSGSIVHVSLFLQPVAGKTPIDPTACSAVVRHLVLARGAAGLYGGGAFVSSDDPGADRLKGTISGGTVRLTRAGEGFDDLLGPSVVEGSFTARFDPQACRALAQRLSDAAARLPRIKTELK